MVMSAKADLTHVCWTLRPASSQILQQSASTEDQLHLTFRRAVAKLYPKTLTAKEPTERGGDIMLQQRRVSTTL